MAAILDFRSAQLKLFSLFRSSCCYSVCFNSNRPTFWGEKSKTGFQDGGYGGHFGISIGTILATFHLHASTCCYIVSFNLIHFVVCKKMSKTDFQDGGCGRHLGFSIGSVVSVVAILCLQGASTSPPPPPPTPTGAPQHRS